MFKCAKITKLKAALDKEFEDTKTVDRMRRRSYNTTLKTKAGVTRILQKLG